MVRQARCLVRSCPQAMLDPNGFRVPKEGCSVVFHKTKPGLVVLDVCRPGKLSQDPLPRRIRVNSESVTLLVEGFAKLGLMGPNRKLMSLFGTLKVLAGSIDSSPLTPKSMRQKIGE